MERRLFLGVEAIESILPIAKLNQARLLNLSNTHHQITKTHYSPWMAIPSTMVISKIDTSWTTDERLIIASDAVKIQSILSSINQDNELIPSDEKYPLAISSLSEDDSYIFNSKIRQAENRLIEILPLFQTLIDHLVFKYIPMESTIPGKSDYAMSTLWFMGGIFMEKRQLRDLDQRAENLAHEIAHQIIINYQLNDPLIDGNLNQLIYSGIRQEERPAILAFHGAAALSYMLWVQSTLQNRERVNLIRTQLSSTLEDLSKLKTTVIGSKILSEFHEALLTLR